ncbi:hypothetical protein VTL71DRAFT_5448 [Oculimacula yallundae]|uniref:BTB domain-containing protein n=1 Tax=Oculimacula yallundae TaxID=86028 RepID=A0ABR4C135_9HELO
MASSTAAALSVAPIVFSARGLKLDVRLQVFDKIFHVHSTILKLHSAYFFKFLDPANAAPVADPAPGSFPYEWVTKVDMDGLWYLVASSDKSLDLGRREDCTKEIRLEENAFEMLLKAMYNRSFFITEFQQLLAVANLADYYLARPILSASLSAALCRSPNLIFMILDNNCEMLILAESFRCDWLFRKSFALSLGPFHDPVIKKLPDAPVRSLAERKYMALQSQVLDAQAAIMQVGIGAYPYNNGILFPRTANGVLSWPQYFRAIGPGKIAVRNLDVDTRTKDLLRNTLDFDDGHVSGVGRFKEHFLCVEVSDDELPWDTAETDF